MTASHHHESSSSTVMMATLIRKAHAMITLTVVGIFIGTLASVMESATHFLADLRQGYCTYNIFLPEYVCCRQQAAAAAASSSSSSSSATTTTGSNLLFFDSDVSFSLTRCDSFVRWSSYYSSSAATSGSSSATTTTTTTTASFVVYVTLTIAMAATAAMICAVHHPRSTTGSGIPEVKKILAGGKVLDNFLSFPVILAKSCSLCLAVGSGLFVGKEGPLVHLGVAVGCTVRRALRRLAFQFPSFQNFWGDADIADDIDLDPPDVSSSQSNELLCAAAAAGVGAGFAAPLGGVMLVVEELSYRFPRRTMIRSFLCAIAATFTLKVIDATYTGRPLQFSINASTATWRWVELVVVFPILGIFCGIAGGLCVKFAALVKEFKKTHSALSALDPVVEVCVVAGLTGVVNFFVPYLDRGAFEVLHDIFLPTAHEDETHSSNVFALFSAGVLRLVAFGITFSGIQVPAGTLVPSLFIGACFGRAVGLIVQRLIGTSASHGAFFRAVFSCAASTNVGMSMMATTTSSAVVDGDGVFGGGGGAGDSFDSSSASASVAAAQSSPCLVSPGLYAALGAAACLTGVTRMTMCLVMIVVEMTGAPSYILPLVAVSLVSKQTVEWLQLPGIYDPPAAAASQSSSSRSGGRRRQEQRANNSNNNSDDLAIIADDRQELTATTGDDDDDHDGDKDHDVSANPFLTVRDFLSSSSSSLRQIELSSGMTLAQVRDSLFLPSSSSSSTATAQEQQQQHQPISRLQSVMIVSLDERPDDVPLLLGVARAGRIIDELEHGACATAASLTLRSSTSSSSSSPTTGTSSSTTTTTITTARRQEQQQQQEKEHIVVFSVAMMRRRRSNNNNNKNKKSGGGSSRVVAVTNATTSVWNWMHLLESSYLVVQPEWQAATLVERLQQDVDTTHIVVMEDGAVPLGAFSRQQIMELFEERQQYR